MRSRKESSAPLTKMCVHLRKASSQQVNANCQHCYEGRRSGAEERGFRNGPRLALDMCNSEVRTEFGTRGGRAGQGSTEICAVLVTESFSTGERTSMRQCCGDA